MLICTVVNVRLSKKLEVSLVWAGLVTSHSCWGVVVWTVNWLRSLLSGTTSHLTSGPHTLTTHYRLVARHSHYNFPFHFLHLTVPTWLSPTNNNKAGAGRGPPHLQCLVGNFRPSLVKPSVSCRQSDVWCVCSFVDFNVDDGYKHLQGSGITFHGTIISTWYYI